MRDAFHESLDLVTDEIVAIARMAGEAMRRATTAVLDADLAAAEEVIAGDLEIDRIYHEVEERSFELFARQQPVAGDLRRLVTGLRMVADLERAGDLALHVAKVARRRYPAMAVPQGLRETFAEMGVVACQLMEDTAVCIATGDVDVARRVEADDDRMDDLHRQLFTVLLSPTWEGDMEGGIDVTLLGRYYERFGDHAVSASRRVVFLVTGERPYA